MELTYDEIMEVLDIKYTSGTPIGNTRPPGIYEISVINLMLKSLLPDEVKVIFTIDDFRLKTNLAIDKTKRYSKKSFFYTIRGFTQFHLGPQAIMQDSFKRYSAYRKARNQLTLPSLISFL